MVKYNICFKMSITLSDSKVCKHVNSIFFTKIIPDCLCIQSKIPSKKLAGIERRAT